MIGVRAYEAVLGAGTSLQVMPATTMAVGVKDMTSLEAESTTEPKLTMLPYVSRFCQEAICTTPLWM